jgi:hypothetical protein
MAMLAIRGTIASRPMETLPTSTMGSTNKEARTGEITSRAQNIKEVIQTSTQFTIQMNLP